jgi:hypothetical protein
VRRKKARGLARAHPVVNYPDLGLKMKYVVLPYVIKRMSCSCISLILRIT